MANLADLQAERERLRADQARAEFEAAWAATVAHAQLVAAAGRVRAGLLAAIDAAEERLLACLPPGGDETAVHHALADRAHDLLAAAGDAAMLASDALPVLGAELRRGVKPRELLSVSQWADKRRYLASGTNAPGPWITARAPYLREIMDDLSEHSPVREVVLMKASGVGGTEVMFNWLGYVMEHLRNKDVLVVLPTLELRNRSFNPRFAKMLAESPALAALVVTASRHKANREDLLEYGAHARVIKAGANSPDSLRSDHLPYVIADEVDAFPWDVGGEGDPMTLIENRQRTFSRAKTLEISTPTNEHASRIAQHYERGDRRRYHVPCPHCGGLQPLEWGGEQVPHGLKFRRQPPAPGEAADLARTVAAAWYVCRDCGAEIDEAHKTDMLAGGRWIAERPHIRHRRSYHLNGLYAPVGLGPTWRDLAQKWLDAQGDTSKLKAFANTTLAEVWKERGDSIENVSLLARVEDYHAAARALPVAVRTGGVDVQKDRLELTAVGWGEGEEGWVIEHHILPGDTSQPDVWDDLDAVVHDLGIEYAAVDAGYQTTIVQAWCAARRWAWATKGIPGMGRPLVEDELRRKQRMRRRRKKGAPIEPVGVDQGKVIVYSRLRMAAPGPGYLHFPRHASIDEEYFAQLAAEKLVTKMRGHRPFQEWVQTRPRNEALDCLLLALVALRLSGASTRPRRAPDPAPPAAPPATRDEHGLGREGWSL